MKSTYRLGDIANISAGQGAPQKESDFSNIGKPFIRAGSLAKLAEGYSENNVCELINDDTAKKYGLRLYPKDTIVFAKSGMSTSKGYVHILSQECYIVNHLACINIYDNDSSYIKYYFMYHRPNKLIKDEAYPSISLADIRNMIISIHNFQTQKEIVAVLDKVTSLIRMRKEQLEKLDILVKSKFIEMFGDPVLNPKGWEKKKLGEVCNLINGKKEKNLNLPLLNVKYLRTRQEKQIYKEGVRVYKNDYIILVDGENSGEVFKAYEDGILGSTFKILDINSDLSDRYILYILNFNKDTFKKSKKGAAIPHLDKDLFRNTQIPIPPLDLQNQFAEFVEQVEKNKENIKSSLNKLETLYSALMQEYFG